MKKLLVYFTNKEFLKFLVVGCSSVCLDGLVYSLMLSLNSELNLSKLVGFISGSVLGFILNKTWTFCSAGNLFVQIISYIFLYTVSLWLNVQTNAFCLELTGLWWFSFLAATTVSTVTNFMGMKFIIFR